MQTLLSDLHRFMATCVKTKGEGESSDMLLLKPAGHHHSELKYFGQSKVEAAAHAVENVKAKKIVFLPLANGPVIVPPRIPTFQQQAIKNQQNNPVDQGRGNGKQMDIDLALLGQVGAKLRDLAECWDECWEKTPGGSLYDADENLSPVQSPQHGTALPAKLATNFKPPPGLEPTIILEMFSKNTIDGSLFPGHYNAGSQLSTCDTTPASPFRPVSFGKPKFSSIRNSPMRKACSPLYNLDY